MSHSTLVAFSEKLSATVSEIFIPTNSLMDDYGVNEHEEAEYGALEVAREFAEGSSLPFIVALEVTGAFIGKAQEERPGLLRGTFTFTSSEVVAYYVITNAEEELEWYDATELALCIAKVER